MNSHNSGDVVASVHGKQKGAETSVHYSKLLNSHESAWSAPQRSHASKYLSHGVFSEGLSSAPPSLHPRPAPLVIYWMFLTTPTITGM